MPETLKSIHQELISLRRDVTFIKTLLQEDFELSPWAKKALQEARETPESEYIDLA